MTIEATAQTGEGGQHEQPRSFGRPSHDDLVKALNHPLRVKILTILTQRVSCPKEMSVELEADLSDVSYHTRRLCELGLVELVSEEPVRGAVRHFYKACERPLLDNAEWGQLSPEVRRAVSAYGMDTIFTDAAAALRKGTFDARSDRHLSRTPLLLDAEGFAHLSEIMDEALGRVLEEQAASAARMSNSSEEPIHTTAALMLFQTPEPALRVDGAAPGA